MREWVALTSHPGLHSASVPGILAVDLSTDNTRILTGGADKTATVFNKDTEQVVAALKGHQKKVNKVVFHPTEDLAITGSHDSTVRVSVVLQGSIEGVRDGLRVPARGRAGAASPIVGSEVECS